MATRTHYILRECNARKRRPNRFASTGAANIPRETGQGRRRSHHRQRADAIRGCLETIQACLRGRREVREGVSQKRCECPCRTPLRSSVALSSLPLSLPLSLSVSLPPGDVLSLAGPPRSWMATFLAASSRGQLPETKTSVHAMKFLHPDEPRSSFRNPIHDSPPTHYTMEKPLPPSFIHPSCL